MLSWDCRAVRAGIDVVVNEMGNRHLRQSMSPLSIRNVGAYLSSPIIPSLLITLLLIFLDKEAHENVSFCHLTPKHYVLIHSSRSLRTISFLDDDPSKSHGWRTVPLYDFTI